MAKKHKLTKKTDHIDGGNGKDLFVAPMFQSHGHEKATLSGKDVLNGRGGVDTIRAFLAADSLTPKLKNIEKAVFTRHDEDELSLNLARSAKLNNIQLQGFDCDVGINHAARLANLTVKGLEGHKIELQGIKADKVQNIKFNFNMAVDTELNIETVKAIGFKTATFSLKDSSVTMAGYLFAETVTLHSNGAANQFAFTPDFGVTHLVVDGAGTLALAPVTASTLVDFNASAMTGDLQANLAGSSLVSVKTGSGNDTLVLGELDLTSGAKAVVNLGSGEDSVDLTKIMVDGNNLAVDGGEGVDTATIYGNPGNVSAVLSSFESLKITKAEGSYDLTGSGIQTVEFLSDADGNNDLAFNYDPTATGGLKSVDGSALSSNMTVNAGGVELAMVKTGTGNDNVTIGALGGTETDKALVDLGAGDDGLDVTAVTLDSATQFFDGGAGIDTVNIKGGNASGLPFLANFENLTIDEAQGLYDLSGSGLEVVIIGSEAMAGAPVKFSYDLPDQGGLQVLDATALNKGMTATIGGANLTTVNTGSGKDGVTLTGLAAMANVNLGAGNDYLDVSDIAGDLSQYTFDGGDGVDSAIVSGDQANWLSALKNFEKLVIQNAAGTYDMTGTGFAYVQLEGEGVDPVNFTYDAPVTGGLQNFFTNTLLSGVNAWLGGMDLAKIVTGDAADNVAITKLGGTTTTKAMVDLKDGDDNLDLTFISVDGATQHIDGGAGQDSVSVYGKAAKFSNALANFENLTIVAAEGSYDIAGIGLQNIVIQSDNLMNNSVDIDNDDDPDSALKSINASVLTSDVTIDVGGANLTAVYTGKGNDDVYLNSLGGQVSAQAYVDTGVGDDSVVMQFTLDGAKHHIDGGAGYDYALAYGAQTDLDGALANFEYLGIVYATGTYTLSGTNWDSIQLQSDNTDAVNFTYAAPNSGGLSLFDSTSLGGNLTAMIGSDKLEDVQTGQGDDQITITKLGGLSGTKAYVALGAGDDILDVTGIALDASTQSFDGELGANTVKISGAVANFTGLLHNFNSLDVAAAKGVYDLSGTNISALKLTSTQGQNVTFQFGAGFENTLTEADASVLSGGVNWTINSNSLAHLEGSQGTDILKLGGLGGTTSILADIDLGTGNDTLDVTSIILDPTRHRLVGGDGIDTVNVKGNLTNISTVLTSFEKIGIDAATGTYDFNNTGITDITLNAATAGLTLNNIADGSKVTINGSAAFGVVLNVVDATANSQDDLTINLGAAASTVGSISNGVSLTGLTTLNLESSGSAHTFNLNSIGGPVLPSVINISGDAHLALNSTSGVKIIKTVNITNTGGVDMSSFDAAPAAFSSSGAFITGGSGGDILVGGNGNDTINAGGGLNTIYGSLGADKLILQTGAANKDILIYDNVAESNGVGRDTVTGFDIQNDRFDFTNMNFIQNFNYIEEFANFALGAGQLSTSSSRAFFALDEHRLYVDVNHDGVIDSTNDFSIVLEGIDDLLDSNFL